MKISKTFLYPSIFLFSPELCNATEIQDKQQTSSSNNQTSDPKQIINKHHLENLRLDIDKLNLSTTVYTSFEHYRQINQAQEITPLEKIIVYKNTLMASKTRTISFLGTKAGSHTTHNLTMVYEHLLKVKTLKILFDPKQLTLQYIHSVTEKDADPKIVHGYNLLIQLERIQDPAK